MKNQAKLTTYARRRANRTGVHAMDPDEKKKVIKQQSFAKTTLRPKFKRYRHAPAL